ncbi:sugar transporter [Trametes punicea]|nr:sugar transporter [Trametes punicea]
MLPPESAAVATARRRVARAASPKRGGPRRRWSKRWRHQWRKSTASYRNCPPLLQTRHGQKSDDLTHYVHHDQDEHDGLQRRQVRPPETGDYKKRDVEAHAIQVETHDIFEDDSGVDPIYQAKARILNDAIQEIGMGRYQWYLFIVAGFGWFSDNLWPIVTGLILDPVVNEFNFQGPFLKLGQNIGLLVGAAFWGVASDVWGRKWCFNLTLFITGVFAIAAGGSPNYIALCSLAAVWSIGVGGNLPVDSAVFLEFIPASHQYLLTILSIWWAFGQLVGSLVAWPLIADFSCASAADCPRSSNQGWRYFLYAMGGLMMLLFIIRFFVFEMYESPKYLMGRGRDAEAVAVVHRVAKYNGRESSLTLEMLQEVERQVGGKAGERAMDTSAKAAVKRKLRTFAGSHVKGLFATKKLAYSTTLLIIVWALIGLAFPLYNGFVTYFLATRGADFGDGSVYITYRNQVILSVIGVPGALLAGWMVEMPYLGRKGTLAISTIITGVFLFASTTARTSDALLGWNCGFTFTSNVMYGVLYAVSPELFPTKDRGTGNAIVASANRVFGIMAPIIALYADLSTSVPIWVSGALFLVSGFIALLLPFEPRGKASI